MNNLKFLKYLQAVLSVMLVLVMISCSNIKQKNSIHDEEQEVDVKIMEEEITMLPQVTERKTTYYDRGIFAGLKMGTTRKEYERIISQYKREYDNCIYLERDSQPITLSIRSITPTFFQNRLSELEITIEGFSAKNTLDPYYTEKYGVTEDANWEWQNLQIQLYTHHRTQYDPKGQNGYYSPYTPMYYDGGQRLTKSPGYTVILYRDLEVQRILRNQKIREDSIKTRKEAEKRKLKEKDNLNKAQNYKNNI